MAYRTSIKLSGDGSKLQKIDADHLVFTKHIGDIVVEPQQQRHLSLGHFTTQRPAKGFSIELEPTPSSTESVVMQTTPIGSSKRYELMLHVANYDSKPVTARIWQL